MPVLKRPWPIIVIGFSLLLGFVRWAVPERSPSATGPRALLDAGFTLGLWSLALLLASAAGRSALRWLHLDGLTFLERLVFRLAIGFGIVAYGVLTLGLAGLLRPWAILAWLLLLAGLTWREWSDLAARLPACLAGLPAAWKRLRTAEKLVCAFGAFLFCMSLIQAITPPWDYDGLMYHLQGPKLYLQSGRLVLLTDLWQANGPFTIEMLFTVGLAFGSDSFARLIHLTFAAMMVLGTHGLGRRLAGRDVAWLAAAVLMGQPIFPLWASFAYIDIAWAAYEFLGLYAVLIWADDSRRRWLVLAGLTIGLAMGSKFLGLGGAAVAGLLVLWFSRRSGVASIVRNAVIYGGSALLVAAPWYIKNWLWAGNPVYPLFFGGLAWDEPRMDLLITYLRSFGTGHRWYDYLLLPVNIYIRRAAFGTFMGSIDVPSPLFLLAIFCFLSRRSRHVKTLVVAIFLRVVVWAAGSHQRRFLLPVFPSASILVGVVLADLASQPRFRRIGRIVAVGLTGGMLVATCAYSLLAFHKTAPLSVIAGVESKSGFLLRVLDGYAATQYIQDRLPQQARVLMLWDGRGYYCDERCMPDPEASLWTQFVLTRPELASITQSLRERGITHLLFHAGDADFWLQHDAQKTHFRAATFFLQEYQPACTRRIYEDDWTVLYEITCP